MAWILTFEAPRNQAVHRYFYGCTVRDRQEPSLWWVDALNRFVAVDDPILENHWHCSNSKPIRTLKAFKRFLRKHPELRGRAVRLVNRYLGYDVTAEWDDS